MQPHEIEPFLDAVERSTGKKFRFRSAIAALMAADASAAAGSGFAELTFLAKFLVNASNLLRRTGLRPEETEHLSSEFSATVERAAALVRRMLGSAPAAVRAELEEEFLAPNHASLAEFLALAEELAWIKNYELDRASKN